MSVNLVLFIWLLGSLLFLAALEAFTVWRGIPTISARVQALGRSATIVVIWVMFAVGYLACHFFEG